MSVLLAVFKILQEMTSNAHLLDAYDYISTMQINSDGTRNKC